MTSSRRPNPIAAVLATGFPLQMGIEQAVRDSLAKHGWEVVGSEFGWQSAPGEVEFADLVLRRDPEVLAIECKRHDAHWVFPRSAGQLSDNTPRTCSRWRRQRPQGPGSSEEQGEWSVVVIEPRSPEAAYCVQLRGDRSKADRLTERLLEPEAGRIVRAVDAIASMLRSSVNGPHDLRHHVITPVIVTTADLSIMDIPAEDVNLASGTIDPARAVLHSVPLVRFTKALGSLTEGRPGILRGLEEHHRGNQRTVIVVTATHFVELLQRWNLRRDPAIPFPWRHDGEPW